MRKMVVLVGDGMGDYPDPAHGNTTPLQRARIPTIRRIAAAGRRLLVDTVPAGLEPGSDIANLSLLGYNPALYYTGRAPIEAVGAGLPLAADDVAFRCNLVTVAGGRMDDYSAGHITTPEGRDLVAAVDAQLGRPGCRFHPGVSYRHLLIWSNGPLAVKTIPPHEFSGKPVAEHQPAGERQAEVRALMDQSIPILASHPVNRARLQQGAKPATQIWLWGQGRRMELPTYAQQYGLGGGVISAVDLVRGLGLLAGLQAPRVPGATGFLDTNYAGKVDAALRILEQDHFVYVHIEAPDECGHMGDAVKKVQAMEAFDERVVAPIWMALEAAGQPYRLVICTDHRTPVRVRGHTREPVPMAILDGPVGPATAEQPFDELVNSGRAQGLAYEILNDLLRDAARA